MFLEVRFSNFYSIKDEVSLSFEAGKIRTEMSKQLANNVFSSGDYNMLKTIALYGANASGKSNIIKVIQFGCAMIWQSHLHNQDVVFNFKPFKFNGYANRPSSFFIRFLSNNVEYEYSFTLTTSQILSESLWYYPHGKRAKVFTRVEGKGKGKKDVYSFSSVIRRPLDVAENTSNKTLYISQASQMDRELPKEIFNYFSQQVIPGINPLNFNANLFNLHKDDLIKALQIADSDIVDLKLEKRMVQLKQLKYEAATNASAVEDIQQEQHTIKSYHKANPNIAFDFESEESGGTRFLLLHMLTILDVVKNNKILLIDEIEHLLHPLITRYILRLFYQGGSPQLLFTTHSTFLLDLKEMRKDQIYFANKRQDGSSDLYSLFDYKDFRETMDLEKAYLQGRFDAIPLVSDSQENLNEILG